MNREGIGSRFVPDFKTFLPALTTFTVPIKSAECLSLPVPAVKHCVVKFTRRRKLFNAYCYADVGIFTLD